MVDPEHELAVSVLRRAAEDALKPPTVGQEGVARQRAREFCLVPRLSGAYAEPADDPAYWRAFWCDLADLDEGKFVEGMRRKIAQCISQETLRASLCPGEKTSPTSSPTPAKLPMKAPVFW